MMTSSRLTVVTFAAGALLAGAMALAQQAPQSPQPAAAAASTPAASPPAQKAADDKAAARSAKAAAAAKKATDQLIKDARDAGFRAEHIGGRLMFCRTAIELESAFPVRTCYDEVQVSIKIEQYRTERNELEALHHIQ